MTIKKDNLYSSMAGLESPINSILQPQDLLLGELVTQSCFISWKLSNVRLKIACNFLKALKHTKKALIILKLSSVSLIKI